MKLTLSEKAAERIALLLLSIPINERDEASRTALDLVHRAERNWWELIGRPHYSKRLRSLHRAWAKNRS